MKLDLSKLKKIASDNKCTTLQHTDGHSIKIAHHVLSPRLKKELDNIPLHKANGGMIKKYADGGGLTEDNDGSQPSNGGTVINIGTQPQQNSSQMPQQWTPDQYKPDPEIERQKQNLTEYYKKTQPGGGLGGISPEDRAANALADVNAYKENPESFSSKSAGDVKYNMEIANPSIPIPEESTSPNIQGSTGPAPLEQNIQPENEPEEETSAPTQNAIVPPDNSNTGINLQPTQPNQAPSLGMDTSFSKEPSTVMQSGEQVNQELTEEAKNWEHDLINQHVTPKTLQSLYHDRGTLGKIGMLFGLLFSGAGSALGHKPDALLQLMQDQINNDLKGQQNSKDNAQNFLKITQASNLNRANIQKLAKEGKLTDAQTKLALAQANGIDLANTQNKMLQSSFAQQVDNVNKMPEGSEKEQAKKVLGFLYNKVGEKIFDTNKSSAAASEFYKTLFDKNQSTSNEEQFQQNNKAKLMLGPEGEKISKYDQERHFPGLKGQASVALSQDEREKVGAGINFQRQLNNLIDFTKKHSGSLNPAQIREGAALAAGLSAPFREVTHGGVYKAGEQDFIGKSIDADPTKFFNKIRVLPKLLAVQKQAEDQLDQRVKNLGYEGYKYNRTSSNVKSSEQPQYKIYNGIKYMRGPDGKAIVVK